MGNWNQEELKKALQLYAVTDRHWLNGRRLADDVERALRGGATFVQLREKDDMKLEHDAFLREAAEIKALCRSYKVPFVIDDDVDLALEIGADGVHVGQSDMETGLVRSRLGKDRIIGVSTQTVEEALLAESRGADYLGVGAVFPTGSKADASEVSMDALRAICKAVSIPVVAIGGITEENVMELAGSGIVGISVISAIFSKEDVEGAARALKSRTIRMLGLSGD
ncbi:MULTISPECIES: thiamine phosphate synthase [unclassified Bilifractor]|uniref:thiamine phosphate synthase n=1 Tax=unclassified Bilifractor TaxID=2815795 RepID=UPI003F90D193